MRVAVVGLGRMGVAIAERLLAAGHEVVVFNRTPGKAGDLVASGARELDRLGDVWSNADVAVTMLSDSSAFQAITVDDGGLLTAGADGKVLIDMSTVSASASAAVAAVAETAGAGYLRAPVSGNPAVVRGGNLGIVTSGSADVYERCRPLLLDIGPNVFHLGDGEQARVMKLALNLMIAGFAELMAEAIALGEAHGLDRAQMLEVMNGSALASPFLKVKTAPLVADDYATTFTTTLMRKDLDMALAAGADGGVPLPVTATVQQLLEACISSGLGDLDFMALLLRLKRDADGAG